MGSFGVYVKTLPKLLSYNVNFTDGKKFGFEQRPVFWRAIVFYERGEAEIGKSVKHQKTFSLRDMNKVLNRTAKIFMF